MQALSAFSALPPATAADASQPTMGLGQFPLLFDLGQLDLSQVRASHIVPLNSPFAGVRASERSNLVPYIVPYIAPLYRTLTSVRVSE